MIEVTENDLEALVFLTKQIFGGNEDVLERYVGGSGSRRVGSFNRLCLHARTAFN